MTGLGQVTDTLGAFLVALFLLILFHEWGHYWVARRFGVKILRFSIGFGRPLWTKRVGTDQTEWVLGLLPLGGYVRFLDDAEEPVSESERPRAFSTQALWKRVAIVSAGPVANFVLAWVLYALIFQTGVSGLRACVDAPRSGTPAAVAGFSAGECVTAFDGVGLERWAQLGMRLAQAGLSHDGVRLDTVDQEGRPHVRYLDLSQWSSSSTDPGDPLGSMGFQPWNEPIAARIGKVLPDSPAALAGLRGGDLVVAADGVDVHDWSQWVHLIESHPGVSLNVRVARQDREEKITLIPAATQTPRGRIGRIGVMPAVSPRDEARIWVTTRESLPDALHHATLKTARIIGLTYRSLAGMLLGELSWKNLGGPIQIATYAGESARHGLTTYLEFLALISISLGCLNLLPIPLLDGGHLLYYALEGLRGRPISKEVILVTQRWGVAFLVVLMGVAFYNDLRHLLTN